MIDFVFDFGSVGCRLAFDPTCRLADELGVPVNWLPVTAEERPAAGAGVGGEETVAERHARVRAAYVAAENARYAERLGIPVRRSGAGVDTSLAAAACLWAGEHGAAREFATRVFREFWNATLDVEDGTAVAAVLESVGAPGFARDEGLARLDAHKARLEERGVFNTPTYLVEDQMFIGRQHLPMIRWLLGGREGPGPL